MGSELLPPGVRPDFDKVLSRTLRGFPDHLLAALVTGLERHGTDLMPGRLYRTPTGGGCPVGVMLRELDPEAFEIRPLAFWMRHGWRRRASGYGGVLAQCPRVQHLEYLFDTSVEAVRSAVPGIGTGGAAHTVGRWITAHAEAELGRRHDGVTACVSPRAEWRDVADVLC